MREVEKQIASIKMTDADKPRKRVVVLGAGMAGLVAAYELASLGHDVSVLEATNRVGGRVWTKRFSSGQYNELGAMRIPSGHEFIRYYIAKCNLQGALRPFITAHHNKNCFYDLRGKQCRIRDFGRVLMDSYNLSALEREIAASPEFGAPAIFGIHLDATVASLSETDTDCLFAKQFLNDPTQKLEGQSLGSYLASRLESDDARELIGAVTGLEPWWEMGISMFIRDEIGKTGDGLEEIAGGMDRLPNELADLLGRARIRFNVAVEGIELTHKGVRVQCRKTISAAWDSPPGDGPIIEELADHVICTIPFGALRLVSLHGFSPLKLRAIRNLNYASSTKVLLHCSRRFWEEGSPDERIIGGASLSDSITRATYYPSDHAAAPTQGYGARLGLRSFRGVHTTFSPLSVQPVVLSQDDPGPGVLLGSYNWGRDARRLGSMSTAERADAVVRALERFHPTIRTYVDDAASMYWDDFRWSRGAFCFMQPGDLPSYYHAAIRPEGGVHFAGEHCSLDQAWINGAVMSGLRATKELVSL